MSISLCEMILLRSLPLGTFGLPVQGHAKKAKTTQKHGPPASTRRTLGRYPFHTTRGPLSIAPALDLAVTLTAVCLGYWFRQNGSTAFLSPGYPDVETRQGAVVQRIFRTWMALLGLDTVGNLLRITAGQNTREKHFQFLRQLKLSLYEAIQVHALQYLQSRVSLQLLPGGVSWAWLTHLATMPKLAVNGVARFAVLRWAVNEDDDECLRLRLAGSLQAEQRCQLCGPSKDLKEGMKM